MTRKDTILIAVLINAALLVALFIPAIKKDQKESLIAEVSPVRIPENPKKEIKSAQGDEIDQVLKEFSEKKVVVRKEEKPEAKKIDFAKELEAITKAAQPEKKVAPQNRSGVIEVTVKKGDALEKIARAHQVSVNAIIDANHLSSTVLQVGQVLKIPSNRASEKPKSAKEPSEQVYIVKAGDNPWSIAVKNKIKLDDLLKLNNLNEEKARRLKPGDRLKIR